MTTPTQLYTALVARYGRRAVDAALGERECFWDCLRSKGWHDEDYPYELALGDRGDWRILPDPVAVLVLIDVAEGMMEATHHIDKDYLDSNHYWVMEITGDGKASSIDDGIYPTKPAAVLAALEAK